MLLEAMACGTSVISSDCRSGPAEILHGGRYGQLIPAGSVDGLRDAIGALLRHPSTAQKIAEQAHAHVANNWSAQVAAERLGEVLKRCARLKSS